MLSSPAVNLDSMRRAKSTLEDFVSSYFMFHNLDASEPLHVFKHLPLLMFVEAHIYQLDQENEDFLAAAEVDTQNPSTNIPQQRGQRLLRNVFAGPAKDQHRSFGEGPDPCKTEQDCQACQGRPFSTKQVSLQAPQKAANLEDQKPAESTFKSRQQVGMNRDKFESTAGQDQKCLLHDKAEALGRNQKPHCLDTEHVNNDASAAIRCTVQASKVLALEQSKVLEILVGTAFAPLSSLLHKESLLTVRLVKQLEDGLEFWRFERKLCQELEEGQQLDRKEVERAVALKSFDYRVLNLLLYGLERKEVNEQHMEFLEASELLVEISDDLFDYEDDVLNNTFNVYRMFLAMYGPQQGQLELAHWISQIEQRYEPLLGGLEKGLADKYRERCRSAAKEGGSKTEASSPMGSWTLPPPIIDEVAYRRELQQSG